jgi:putative membrane protein
MKSKLSTFLTLAFFSLFHPVLAFAEQAQQPPYPYDWHGPGHMWGGGWGFWWIGPLVMLCFIILCVALFMFIRRSGGGHHHCGPPWHMTDRPWGTGRSWGDPTDSALQILNERYARGEIQKQEYEEKKAVILSSGQH